MLSIKIARRTDDNRLQCSRCEGVCVVCLSMQADVREIIDPNRSVRSPISDPHVQGPF